MPITVSLTASTYSSNSILLEWNAENYSNFITIEVSMISPYTKYVGLADTISNSFVVENLDPDTEYGFQLHVWYREGDQPYETFSNIAYARTYPVLVPPTDLRATAYGSFVDLTWKSQSFVGVDGIEIWRDSGSGYEKIAEVWPNEEFYRDVNANLSITYSYKIRAYQGENFSNFSDTVSVAQYSVPGDVTNLRIGNTGSSWIELLWNEPAGTTPIAGYIIEVNYGSGYVEYARVPHGINSIVVSGLSQSTQYNFRVKACNGAGSSSGQTINGTTRSADSENYLSYLSRQGAFQPFIAFEITTESGNIYFTSEANSAFDSYTCFHHLIQLENLTCELRLQPFFRPGFVSSSGEISIFNFDSSYFRTNNFLGKNCRVLFGDARSTNINDYFSVSGGIISSVRIEKDKVTFSFEDQSRVLDQTIALNRNEKNDPIPIVYGSAVVTGFIENNTKKRIKFCDHRIKDIVAVYKNNNLLSSSQYRVDKSSGAIVLDLSETITEDDVFTALVNGKTNIADEAITQPAAIIYDLCSAFKNIFSLSWLAAAMSLPKYITIVISEDETYSEVIKRIMTTCEFGLYNQGNQLVFTWGTPINTGLAFDENDYEKKSVIKSVADLIRAIIINYSYTSDIPEDNKFVLPISNQPANAEEIELAIYGSNYLAEEIANKIALEASRWTVETDFGFLLPTLLPNKTISIDSETIRIEKISFDIFSGKTSIAGVVLSQSA